MRHRKKVNHLGRTSSHRKAMLSNMATSLILHKRIKTTVAKAKALRMYVEPLINKTKNLSTVEEKTHAQRVVFSYLQNKFAVKELFGEVADKVATRPGGYTRILKLGARIGDAAEMCLIELVDYNENMLGTAKAADDKKKTTRRSRAKKVEGATDSKKSESASKDSSSEE
jgi:large subunit ribosomal protein L17